MSTDSETPALSPAVITRVVGGDQAAWHDLVRATHPLIIRICRHRGYRTDHTDQDTPAEVSVRVLGLLRARHLAALRKYLATCRMSVM